MFGWPLARGFGVGAALILAAVMLLVVGVYYLAR
jgi:homoserine kinase